MYRVFDDRYAAGRALVPELQRCRLTDPVVLGLPRGGIPVAYEIALALHAPLDTMVVRKLGLPWQPELAFGAVASGGIRVINEDVLHLGFELDETTIEAIAKSETDELRRRERTYRGDRPFPDLTGKQVVLVDDGLATGATMLAAAEAVARKKPDAIIVAVPTGSASAVARLSRRADKVVCLQTPENFYAVGQFYANFSQTTDAEVRELLDRARDAYQGHAARGATG